MKKLLAVILSVLMIGCVFAACSSSDETETTSGEKDTSATSSVSTTKTIETENAAIKDSDAINFIKNAYTEEELGLADVKDSYTFMVSKSGVYVEGVKYIKVAANVMTQSDVTTDEGKATYSFEAVGEYYISYDGKTVLKKDMKTGKYEKLENRYDDYKSKGETAKEDTTEKK